MRRPLSVNYDDAQILTDLITIHAETETPCILDCTYNQGRIWGRSRWEPIAVDIDPKYGVTCASAYALPFPSKLFDVVVFDPPHLPNAAGSENSSKIWEHRFGLIDGDHLRSGDNVTPTFAPFLQEAKRVLKPGGIALVKITDITHNHAYQWQHVDLILIAREMGLTPCDLAVRLNNGGAQSGRWKTVKHLQKAHSYWVAIRNAGYEVAKRDYKPMRFEQTNLFE